MINDNLHHSSKTSDLTSFQRFKVKIVTYFFIWFTVFSFLLLSYTIINLFIAEQYHVFVSLTSMVFSIAIFIYNVVKYQKTIYLSFHDDIIVLHTLTLHPADIQSIVLSSNGKQILINRKEGSLLTRTIQLILEHNHDKKAFRYALQQYQNATGVDIIDNWDKQTSKI